MLSGADCVVPCAVLLQAPRKTGGFFSGLNQKRRDGGQERGRQVTLLLHTNKRLEEATHK